VTSPPPAVPAAGPGQDDVLVRAVNLVKYFPIRGAGVVARTVGQVQADDLEVVRHVSDQVTVMYLGRIAEQGPKDPVYDTPRHPYTAALLSAAPAADPDAAARQRIILTGDIPSPINPPADCRFHPRCPKARDLCHQQEPALETKPGDPAAHQAACHFPLQPHENLTTTPAAGASPG
jgi:oligopeptide/dipeptide ABC transporter ATP-binding protein